MCLHPTLLQNPNVDYNTGVMKIDKGKYIKIKIKKDDIRYYKDKLHKFLYIKCGYCSECIHEKINNYAQRILMESINNHMFLCTLTYKNSMLPKWTFNNGITVPFADTKDVSMMLERLDKWRNRCRHDKQYIPWPYKILAVSELGGEKARPHFHIIFMIPKRFAQTEYDIKNMEEKLYWTIRNNWARNEGTARKPIYEPLFTYHESWTNGKLRKNYDLHYVRPETTENGVSDAAFYVLKYLIKQQNNYGKSNKEKDKTTLNYEAGWEYKKMRYLEENIDKTEFDKVWPMIRSRVFYSKYFGLNKHLHYDTKQKIIDKDIEEYIKHCIEWSKGKYEFPVFINPINKRTSPLCNYYRKIFMTTEDHKFFWKDEIQQDLDRRILTPSQLSNKLLKAKRVEENMNKLTELDYSYND